MENAFLWLIKEFGEESVKGQILLPSSDYFKINFDTSQDLLKKVSEIVAQRMEIDIDDIDVTIFNQKSQQLFGEFGHKVFTGFENSKGLTSGLYYGKNKNDKYEIYIEQQNLYDLESLIATIAHEFSHIKILGERRLEINDESLTDLTTVHFGFGVFNANSAYKETKTFESWGYRSIGYLKQKEWGYALGLYAYYRNEKTPEWIKYLTPNIQSDFKRSENYIYANPDKIFKEKNNDS